MDIFSVSRMTGIGKGQTIEFTSLKNKPSGEYRFTGYSIAKNAKFKRVGDENVKMTLSSKTLAQLMHDGKVTKVGDTDVSAIESALQQMRTMSALSDDYGDIDYYDNSDYYQYQDESLQEEYDELERINRLLKAYRKYGN